MRFNYSLVSILVYASLALFFVACEDDTHKKETIDYAAIKEQMLKVNSKLVEIEDESINKFIERKGWEMKETGTGLRWMLIENGEGERAQTGQLVSLEYEVYLFSGQLIYSSKTMGIKSFKIGYGGVERGLEEGILFLKLGDKARFILPSHLAYGLQGDGQSIPRKVSLLYEVELIELK